MGLLMGQPMFQGLKQNSYNIMKDESEMRDGRKPRAQDPENRVGSSPDKC